MPVESRPTIIEVTPPKVVPGVEVANDVLTAPGADVLLRVEGLSTHFFTPDGVVQAVDDVSFDVGYGETLGLVGESGCGKSVTALSIARLVPDPPGRIVSGSIVFDGMDVLKLSQEGVRKLRGKEIGFIFQDPLTSLNPTLTIGYQIAEAIREHMEVPEKAAKDRVVELLSKVGIPRARERLKDYPFQFSGGMRQRVMIAIALSCDPKLILADEPTTALDVTIQAQILELIQQLADEFRTAVLLITHDLGIAAGMCDRVNVMYAGRIVETDPSTSCSSRRRCRTRGACSIRCRKSMTSGATVYAPSKGCRRSSSPRRTLAGSIPDATTPATSVASTNRLSPREVIQATSPAAGRPSQKGGSDDRDGDPARRAEFDHTIRRTSLRSMPSRSISRSGRVSFEAAAVRSRLSTA